MLKNEQRSQNFNAVSAVTVGSNDETVAYLSASVTSDNNASFNQIINDLYLYKTNKETVENDYEEFKNHVLESLE